MCTPSAVTRNYNFIVYTNRTVGVFMANTPSVFHKNPYFDRVDLFLVNL